MMNEDTLEGEGIIMIEVEDHQIEEMTRREVIQEEEDPLMIEDHQIENPQMMEDPLMMEDPWKWKTSKTSWNIKHRYRIHK